MATEPTKCSKMLKGCHSTLQVLSSGEACGARWMLGLLLLVPLAVTDASYSAVPAVALLAVFATVATVTCNHLKKLGEILPPKKTARGRRERNLRCFADFMAIWVYFLAHLVAMAVCARILSATADHVTGGRTRRWLFGYETRALGEPWPDVMGVTVVMIVCGMYMCGLEENVMFTFMLLFILYAFSQFFAIVGLMNCDVANIKIKIPISVYELFSAGAPISYSFSVILSRKEKENVTKYLLLKVGFPMVILTGISFVYANMMYGYGRNVFDRLDASVPAISLMEIIPLNWIGPALAAGTVLGVCLALCEVCPILFAILVTLATPEWKVLTRSMTYESTTTGSHVLAVFTAGSLAAILAFACPLSHMVTLMNASHLLYIAVQSLHFIIMRCDPTAEQKEAGDVEYKRLGKQGASRSKSGLKMNRGLWFIPSAIRHTKTLESIKSKVTIKETEERECLLLDEYAGCPTEELDQMTSCSSGVREASTEVVDVPSDGEASEQEISSGDDSTDIDAVVKEYKDRIQVVTAPPEARAPAPPTVRGSHWAAAGAAVQLIAGAIIAVGFCKEAVRVYLFATGIPLWLCGTIISMCQPAHSLSARKTEAVEGPVTLLVTLLYLTPLLVDSWPAITLFAGAGVVIYARCERWCGDLAVQQARTTLEKRKLRTAVPLAGPLTRPRCGPIDTVYISR